MRHLKRLLSLTFVFAVVIASGSFAHAQRGSLPSVDYYSIFPLFYEAEYRDAGRQWQRGYNTAFRVGNNRFLDSVCYLTMIGECHYHVGNYGAAVENYEAALQLYLSFNATQWQTRLRGNPIVQNDLAAVQRARITWGRSNRGATIGKIPDTISMLYGRIDSERAFVEGGPVDNAELRQVNVVEVMRCTALAMHRRRVIKGPTCKIDPLTANLVRGMSVAGAGDGSLIGSFNGILLGLAHASNEDWDKAARTLSASLQLRGGVDHPLTPVALTELCQIATMTGKKPAAIELALEASYSAAIFSQYDLIEESLSTGAQVHMSTTRSPWPPLESAVAWANRERPRPVLMRASLAVRLAEGLMEAKNITASQAMLAQAQRSITNRNDLPRGIVQTRLQYITAANRLLSGDIKGGIDDLKSALDRLNRGSLWLYRLELTKNLIRSDSIRELQADQLFERLLRDPNDAEWLLDPMEALAFLTSDHVDAIEVWFDILVARRKYTQAAQVAELLRRHRFYSALPLGGRLLSLRWALNADATMLSKAAAEDRNKFLQRNRGYQLLSIEADDLQRQLSALPAKIEPDSDEAKQQRSLLEQLANLSRRQDEVLTGLTVRREPADMTFPPQMPLEDFQLLLEPQQVVVSTVATGSGYHLFFVTADSVKYAYGGKSRSVQNGVLSVLKGIGAVGNAADPSVLNSDAWREPIRKLKEQLFEAVPESAWTPIREVIVVPDGLLWYLPFELFPVGADGDRPEALFGDQFLVRFAPTLFLSAGTRRKERFVARPAVVTGRLHPRGDSAWTDEAFDALAADVPTVQRYRGPLKIPANLLITLPDALMVWHENQLPKNSLDLRPLAVVDAIGGGSIQNLMTLPTKGVSNIALAGIDPLNRSDSRATGAEMFLMATGMMASGSHTVLLPRWSTGGKNSLALTRSYLTWLERLPPAKALKQAKKESLELPFDVDSEPRVKRDPKTKIEKTDAPFFWAGNMLVEIPLPIRAEANDVENAEMAAERPADPPAAPAGKKKLFQRNAIKTKPAEEDAVDMPGESKPRDSEPKVEPDEPLIEEPEPMEP